MLKLLYKTFLISVMSGSLMTMNMTAFAEETATSNSAIAKMSKTTDSGITRDANGVLKKTETHKFAGVADMDMLASITMLSTGTIAGRIAAIYAPLNEDVMIAAVGGMAFMAGEIISNVKFKKTIDDINVEISKSSDGKKDQAQIDRLVDLRKSYEEAKKTTNTKKTLQLAAAAAFAGASAFAAYKAFQEYTLFATCINNIKSQVKIVNTCLEAKKPSPDSVALQTACQSCSAQLAGMLVEMGAVDAARKSPGPSMIENKETNTLQEKAQAGLASMCNLPSPSSAAAKGVIVPSCLAALSIESINQVFSYKPTASIFSSNNGQLINKILFGQASKISYEQMQSKERSAFEKMSDQVLSLFLPKAQASWIPLLGLGASTAAAYFLIAGTQATTVDMQMFVPFNRMLAFGGLATLSLLASKSSDNVMGKLDQNIAKIDVILRDLNTLQNGIKLNTINTQQLQFPTPQIIQAEDIPLSSDASVKTDCASSMGAENCTPLSGQLSAMPGFADLPDSFKTIASQSAQLGDGLSGVNAVSGSTMTAASSLAGKQNAIAKLLAKTQSKLNDQLASMGQPKIDFAKEQNDLLNKWNAQTAKGLKSKGISPGNFLASIGGTPVNASTAAPKTARTKTTNKFFVPASSAVAAAAPANNKGFELDLKETPPQAEILAGAAAAEKEKKFDIGLNDISTDSSESIFQLITNRYIKSGYPKLLDEIPVKK